MLILVCILAPCPPAARAQSSGAPADVVISQVYARGGEQGSVYRSDFVEIFNRGSVNVDVSNWALEVRGFEGRSDSSLVYGFSSSNNILQPGQHILYEFGRGTEGQVLPPPDFPDFFGFYSNISGAGAYVALYRSSPTPYSGRCPSGADLVDVVGFGTATCREGFNSVAAPSATQSLLRRDGGCTDTDDNTNDFQLGAPDPRNSLSALTPCGGIQPSVVRLSQLHYEASESADHITVTVKRDGSTNGHATVDYLTQAGTADGRKDYTPAFGTLSFAPGEASKTIDVLLTDDAFAEGDETVNFDLIGSTGVSLGSPRFGTLVIRDNDAAPSPNNPADDSTFFVRQHYHDFLNRAPDPSGLAFWTGEIENCGADRQCREVKRINVSAAFFLSIEFQQTGFLAYRAHKAAFQPSGNHPQGMPLMQMLQRDQQFLGRGVVVGQTGWEQALEANTRAYFEEFVTRFDFRQSYNSLTNAQYVDALNANTLNALAPAERDALVEGLNSGTETRATALRKVAESRAFSDAEKNRAFVLMQYFGYLRRNPNESPDSDFSGWQFWLDKLNSFSGDFIRAEMVKAFIDSLEYRSRFGQ